MPIPLVVYYLNLTIQTQICVKQYAHREIKICIFKCQNLKTLLSGGKQNKWHQTFCTFLFRDMSIQGVRARTDTPMTFLIMLVLIQTMRKILFSRIRESKLTVHPSECYIGFGNPGFNGHNVGNGILSTEKDKLTKSETLSNKTS